MGCFWQVPSTWSLTLNRLGHISELRGRCLSFGSFQFTSLLRFSVFESVLVIGIFS